MTVLRFIRDQFATYYEANEFEKISLPNVLCKPTELFWRQGIPFEEMTGRTAFINGLLAEVSGDFLSFKLNARRYVHRPRIISLSPNH